MSEVPEGIDLAGHTRGPPRPTATMTLTRDGPNGVEVLLGLRSKTMRAFPSYWAFPGGGISSVDKSAVEDLKELAGPESASIACILREMSEELGLVPGQDGMVALPDEARLEIVKNKRQWLPLAKEGAFPVDRSKIRTLSHRITPPFGPVQFDNAFLHIHAGSSSEMPVIDLEPQTEFTEIMWAAPKHILRRWKAHEIKVAPPVVTLLMEIERTLDRHNRDMEAAAQDIAERLPGRRSILFAHGVEVIPIKTATLPPADHTNAYLVGDPKGDFVLVDPAVRMREDMEALATAVERHQGTLIAIIFTHSHNDHLADMPLLKEAFDVPIWGSEHTSKSVNCDRILIDGETLQLGKQTWTVLITPGHHPGHICLHSDAGLVAGDMLAGIGTILIPPYSGNMNVYIQQLRRLKAMQPHLVFPSHGPVVPMPDQLIQHYITHRLARHERVLHAVEEGNHDVRDIAEHAYSDTPGAHPGLAIDQTLSHLLAHAETGSVQESEGMWHLKEA
jgi:glyoxylase-like metal-dependent hydrolase (beta-lactamase superfamily II)/8-oxo-dGTP pyrophosphatase MutT (NUDIX family)